MVNTAQIGRQLFDIYNLMFLRILSLCLIYKTDYKDLIELRRSHKNIIERIQVFSTSFEESYK